MSIYETLSLMIALALLMITVINKNDKKITSNFSE
ncbi:MULTISPECIES: putative holin-like toxin [Lactococcus]